MRVVVGLVLACLLLGILPSVALGQQPHAYVGGALGFATVPHNVDQPLGGTTWSGSASVGVPVSRSLGVEFEACFTGQYTNQYSYRPGPSWTADVVALRREMFFSVLLRARAGVVEPVVGMSFVDGHLERHATTGGRPYFDDQESQLGLGLAAGLDARLPIAPRVFIVPAFRLIVVARHEADAFVDPLASDTATGPLVFRAGVGARVTF